MTDVKKPTQEMAPVQAAPQLNPAGADASVPVRTARKRIPLSTARRRLEVPAIPGYNLHWFLERNLEFAIQGYYEFVNAEEVHLNQHSPGTPMTQSGNQDLGSHVSMVTTAGDGPTRLYLMKIKLEYFNEDQQALQEENLKRLSAIFVDQQVFTANNTPDALQMKPKDSVTYGSALSNLKPLLQRKYVSKT